MKIMYIHNSETVKRKNQAASILVKVDACPGKGGVDGYDRPSTIRSSDSFGLCGQSSPGGGWSRDVRITIADGRIKTIEVGVAALPEDERHALIVSGMPNLHSHAFQYGMAGLAERRGPSSDSFWSWREIMYKFALTMSPDQAEAVALRLYVEMLEAGFTRVGEFHYLHHDRDGTHYSNPAEMAVRIASAARRSGIGLTLLPVFYAHSTFGGVQPNEGQRRFIHDPDSFERLIAGCQRAIVDFDGAVLGVAPTVFVRRRLRN